VLNYKSTNDIELNDNVQFPINNNINSYIKLSNFGIKPNQVKSVRFFCTLNSSPPVGIHFESENEKLKELVLNN